ncbi:efflux RND transporter periplasmic adaptor subunit [Lacunimicrobium album]
MTQTPLNLKDLAIDRRPQEKPTAQRPRRRNLLSRYVLPGVVVVGFMAVLMITAGDQFLPRQNVTVIPVIVSRADIQQEGTELFQAPGWIEPRPTSINVPALTQGVIERLLVVEGQDVEKGQPVAELIRIDSEFAVRQAKATLDLRLAEQKSARASLQAAQLRHDQPVHLQSVLAEAQSALDKTRTAVAQVPFLTESARAKVDYARQNLEGKKAAGSAVPQRLVQEAESILAAAEADLHELANRPDLLKKELQSQESRATAQQTQLKLLIDETRQLHEAHAACEAAQAKLDEAQVALDRAKLELERTIVTAPVAGRVLRLIAYPGARVMGMEANAGQSSSTVVEMYDPRFLQLRADVRLEDVPLVLPGQKVRIVSASLKEPIEGTVLLPTSTANIQKNTLEVKVAIPDLSNSLRPEMLATATFLAPPTQTTESASQQAERLLVPRNLIDADSSQSAVWIVDSQGFAQRRPVTLGKAGTPELVEVTAGLHPTDRLIASDRSRLSPGDRVVITGEDKTLGISQK